MQHDRKKVLAPTDNSNGALRARNPTEANIRYSLPSLKSPIATNASNACMNTMASSMQSRATPVQQLQQQTLLTAQQENARPALFQGGQQQSLGTPTHERQNAKKYVYYLDIADMQTSQKVQRMIETLGGKCATFLDVSVTHIIADRESKLAGNRPPGCTATSIALEDFVSWSRIMLADSAASGGCASPSFASALSIATTNASQLQKKHLARCLTNPIPSMLSQNAFSRASAITQCPRTPVGSGLASNNAAAKKQSGFRAFEHPFVKISDCEGILAPVFKEYFPQKDKPITYPRLFLVSTSTISPFLQPPPPPAAPAMTLQTADIRRRSALAVSGMMTRSKAAAAAMQRGPRTSSAMVSTAKTSVALPVPQSAMNGKIVNAHHIQQRQHHQQQPKPRQGYCECCQEKFSDQDKHVRGSFHREFMNDCANFIHIDRLISEVQRCPLKSSTGPENISPALMQPSQQHHSMLVSPQSKSSQVSITMRKSRNRKRLEPLELDDFVEHKDGDEVDPHHSHLQISSPIGKRHRSKLGMAISSVVNMLPGFGGGVSTTQIFEP